MVGGQIFIYWVSSIYDQLIYYFYLIVPIVPFITDIFMIAIVLLFFSKHHHIIFYRSLYSQHIWDQKRIQPAERYIVLADFIITVSLLMFFRFAFLCCLWWDFTIGFSLIFRVGCYLGKFNMELRIFGVGMKEDWCWKDCNMGMLGDEGDRMRVKGCCVEI